MSMMHVCANNCTRIETVRMNPKRQVKVKTHDTRQPAEPVAGRSPSSTLRLGIQPRSCKSRAGGPKNERKCTQMRNERCPARESKNFYCSELCAIGAGKAAVGESRAVGVSKSIESPLTRPQIDQPVSDVQLVADPQWGLEERQIGGICGSVIVIPLSYVGTTHSTNHRASLLRR